MQEWMEWEYNSCVVLDDRVDDVDLSVCQRAPYYLTTKP